MKRVEVIAAPEIVAVRSFSSVHETLSYESLFDAARVVPVMCVEINSVEKVRA